MSLSGQPLRGMGLASSLAKNRPGGESLNGNTSLATKRLKERIVRTLETGGQKSGTNDAVSWRGLWIELGVTEQEFCEALNAAAEEHPRAIVFTDSDHIRLNLKHERSTVSTNAQKLKTASQGLTTRFIRFLSGFSKGEIRQVDSPRQSTPSNR